MDTWHNLPQTSMDIDLNRGNWYAAQTGHAGPH